MTEREIIETIFSIYDRNWSIVQWWATVSFGLIAIAQLEKQKLNIYLVILLILIYSIFTGWMGSVYLFNTEMLSGFNRDLASLGDLMHRGSSTIVYSHVIKRGIALEYFAALMTYIGSILYLLYSFFSEQSLNKDLS